MDEVIKTELRNKMHDVVKRSLSDEGVLPYDQATAIGRAVMGAMDVLLEHAEAPDRIKDQSHDD